MFHRQPNQRLSLLPKRIALLTVAAALSACQLQGFKKEKQATLRPATPMSRLEATVALQRARIMELELLLLAKQSEIHKLSSTQEHTIQEVVRVKAKLRSRNSKAETVANLAEVKLTLESLQAGKGQNLQAKPLERARQYISMGEAALENGNYDGAFYLIGQARASLAAADTNPEEHLESNAKRTVFPLPVPMKVTQRCNVRAGPGLEKKVLYRLNAGAVVLATGYRGLWIQVKGGNDTKGWIHYSLLKTSR